MAGCAKVEGYVTLRFSHSLLLFVFGISSRKPLRKIIFACIYIFPGAFLPIPTFMLNPDFGRERSTCQDRSQATVPSGSLQKTFFLVSLSPLSTHQKLILEEESQDYTRKEKAETFPIVFLCQLLSEDTSLSVVVLPASGQGQRNSEDYGKHTHKVRQTSHAHLYMLKCACGAGGGATGRRGACASVLMAMAAPLALGHATE